MDKFDEYRGYAAECVRLAMRAARHENKALLLEMAQRWAHLAVMGASTRGDSPEEVPRQQPSVPRESLN